ncbi:MerR family transcriptional regulator [Streptomyces sp. M19]
MRIGDAAAAVGMTTRALRYYEQRGLLTARRTASGQRDYTRGTCATCGRCANCWPRGSRSRTYGPW